MRGSVGRGGRVAPRTVGLSAVATLLVVSALLGAIGFDLVMILGADVAMGLELLFYRRPIERWTRDGRAEDDRTDRGESHRESGPLSTPAWLLLGLFSLLWLCLLSLVLYDVALSVPVR